MPRPCVPFSPFSNSSNSRKLRGTAVDVTSESAWAPRRFQTTHRDARAKPTHHTTTCDHIRHNSDQKATGPHVSPPTRPSTAPRTSNLGQRQLRHTYPSRRHLIRTWMLLDGQIYLQRILRAVQFFLTDPGVDLGATKSLGKTILTQAVVLAVSVSFESIMRMVRV